jgi:hypothetical protein
MNTFRRPKLNKAIRAINPDAEFTYNNDDVSTIKWCNDTAPIPAEDILAKLTELQAEYDALEYARKRKAEYPAIADQLDKIYHDGIDSWKEEMILPVKNKFPKT